MAKGDRLDRREFTLRSVAALLGGATITLQGCSGGAGGPAQPSYVDTVGNVVNNHGHTVTITAAQLAAGGGVVLEIQGSSTHPHQIELTAGEVVAIRAGTRVSKDSSPSPSGSHNHTVVFN
jgi:hypothetical protein